MIDGTALCTLHAAVGRDALVGLVVDWGCPGLSCDWPSAYDIGAHR